MRTKEFVKKVEGVLDEEECLTNLKFKMDEKWFAVKSQWFSGTDGQEINLWACSLAEANKPTHRLYPIMSEDIDNLEFKHI